MKRNCCFCEEYQDPVSSQYYQEIGSKTGVTSRILMENDHWYAVPTLGCMTIGYMLLVCKEHYLSLANLDTVCFEEMLSLKATVERKIHQTLGVKCLAFEHGSTETDTNGANSVDHVHLHVVPFQNEIWPMLSQKYHLGDFEEISGYQELRDRWKSEFPKTYLLFQDVNQRIYYKTDVEDYSSQFFRKCLAPYLSMREWDWKQEEHEENLLKTIELFC